MKKDFNKTQRIMVAVLDALLLAELTLSIYLCHRSPETMTAVFLKTYIPMALITMVFGLVLIKKCGVRGTPPRREAAINKG
jgi:uncharacterized membrane protein SirB2